MCCEGLSCGFFLLWSVYGVSRAGCRASRALPLVGGVQPDVVAAVGWAGPAWSSGITVPRSLFKDGLFFGGNTIQHL